MECSDAVKLAGFKTGTQVASLAEVSKRTLLYDFDIRFSYQRKPRFIATLRKAMDKKHMIERAVMEAAIVEIMKKGVEN